MTAEARRHLVDGVADALDAAGFTYERIAEVAGRPRVLRMQVLDEHGQFVVLFFAQEGETLARCAAHFPERVPAERIAAAHEAILRANVTLDTGALAIDRDDGAVKVWTVAAVEGDAPVPAVAMLMTCWNVAARFNAVLQAVVRGSHDARSAIDAHWTAGA